MTQLAYIQGSELPSAAITWLDDDGNVIDFSSGYTFELRIGTSPDVTIKTGGITGAAAAPNITVDWATGELDSIPRGGYQAQLWARRTSDSKDRVLPLTLHINEAIT